MLLYAASVMYEEEKTLIIIGVVNAVCECKSMDTCVCVSICLFCGLSACSMVFGGGEKHIACIYACFPKFTVIMLFRSVIHIFYSYENKQKMSSNIHVSVRNAEKVECDMTQRRRDSERSDRWGMRAHKYIYTRKK